MVAQDRIRLTGLLREGTSKGVSSYLPDDHTFGTGGFVAARGGSFRGRGPLMGEASAAAQAHGVKAGLRLGEALARCPSLRLVAPDPAGVADEWDRVLSALEGIGAEVESERPGIACFGAGGLLNLHGG